MKQLRSSVLRFLRRQDGGATVETVLWLPVYVMILALVTDAAMIYSSQARALRVVQDANRSMSIGRFRSIEETEAFIRVHLAPLSPRAIVETVVVQGVIISRVQLPAADLSATKLLGVFSGLNVGVQAQHVSEV